MHVNDIDQLIDRLVTPLSQDGWFYTRFTSVFSTFSLNQKNPLQHFSLLMH